MSKGVMREYDFSGRKVKTEIELNPEQEAAVRGMVDFIFSPETGGCMTLMGFAGTGKTTLMGLVHDICMFDRPVQFAATTHKAAGVLKGKVGEHVSTVNSLFGIMIEQDLDVENFDVSVKKRREGDVRLRKGGVVVIDEASMLSEENFRDVMEKAREFGVKVIFVGDPAQLAPVGEDDVSVVFREGDWPKAVLRKVERTGDNGILLESMRVRNTGEFSMEDSGGVGFLDCRGDGVARVFDEYIPGLRKDPNFFRVLSYTNRNVEAVNRAVRNRLGLQGVPVEGEPMMGYSNWGYDWSRSYTGTPYKFINSESYRVLGVDSVDTVDVSELADVEYGGGELPMTVVKLVLKDPIGLKVRVPYIDVRENPGNLKAAAVLAHQKKLLWNRWREAPLKEKGPYLARIGELDDMLFVNDNIRDGLGFLLQAKVIDFGYAHTIHKSQGSTFRHVLVNDTDILSCPDRRTRRQLRYVAVTRASETVDVIVRK